VSVDVLIEGRFDMRGAAAQVAYEVRSRSHGLAATHSPPVPAPPVDPLAARATGELSLPKRVIR
jgi:hypothetical protein